MSDQKNQETKKDDSSPEKTPYPEHVQKEIDPKSFCSISTLTKTNTLKAPYPIRLTLDQLTCEFETQFLKGFTIRDNSGVYCLKKDVVEKQSGIIKEVITQLTKCIWTGGVMSLSLPIRIFEPHKSWKYD